MSGFLLFLPGLGSTDETLAGHLAASSGHSLADARLLLRSLHPRRIGAYASADEAEDRALALRSGGFDAFVVPREALDRMVFPPVSSARFEGGGVSFRPEGGFAPGRLKLIVLGEYRLGREVIRRDEAQDRNGRMIEANLQREQTRDEQEFLHLYGADPGACVEVRAREFEYRSCLGPRLGPTTTASLRALAQLLRETFPAALYDDLLRRKPPPPDFDVRTRGIGTTEETRSEDNEKPARAASFLLAWRLLRPS